MKKYWITTAILAVLLATVPVFATETLPIIEDKIEDILARLEKVEAYEERISALERQIAELTSPPLEPSPTPITMTVHEYNVWMTEVMQRGSDISDRMDRMSSGDPAAMISLLVEMSDFIIQAHEEHSLIETPHKNYNEMQSTLNCLATALAPLSGIEDATFIEAMTIILSLQDIETCGSLLW